MAAFVICQQPFSKLDTYRVTYQNSAPFIPHSVGVWNLSARVQVGCFTKVFGAATTQLTDELHLNVLRGYASWRGRSVDGRAEAQAKKDAEQLEWHCGEHSELLSRFTLVSEVCESSVVETEKYYSNA